MSAMAENHGNADSDDLIFDRAVNLLYEEENIDEARTLAKKGYNIQKNEGAMSSASEFLMLLAEIEFIEENFQKALEYDLEALHILKDIEKIGADALLNYQLGRDYFELGNKRKAKSYFMAVIDLDEEERLYADDRYAEFMAEYLEG